MQVIESDQQERRVGWMIYEEIGVAILNVAAIDPYQRLLNQARTYLSKTYDVAWDTVCEMEENYTIKWFKDENPNFVVEPFIKM